ncbi:hypothetical protein [Kitasatospora sp. NPDC007106]|uniref:hypothetical protein n=1 Tax=Kitasatospora sp. NPDC007106 TaxID=3156914 RepID=UPI0033C00703
MAIPLATAPDLGHTAHAERTLAAPAADHVAALPPEPGGQRMRTGLFHLARSAM